MAINFEQDDVGTDETVQPAAEAKSSIPGSTQSQSDGLRGVGGMMSRYNLMASMLPETFTTHIKRVCDMAKKNIPDLQVIELSSTVCPAAIAIKSDEKGLIFTFVYSGGINMGPVQSNQLPIKSDALNRLYEDKAELFNKYKTRVMLILGDTDTTEDKVTAMALRIVSATLTAQSNPLFGHNKNQDQFSVSRTHNPADLAHIRNLYPQESLPPHTWGVVLQHVNGGIYTPFITVIGYTDLVLVRSQEANGQQVEKYAPVIHITDVIAPYEDPQTTLLGIQMAAFEMLDGTRNGWAEAFTNTRTGFDLGWAFLDEKNKASNIKGQEAVVEVIGSMFDLKQRSVVIDKRIGRSQNIWLTQMSDPAVFNDLLAEMGAMAGLRFDNVGPFTGEPMVTAETLETDRRNFFTHMKAGGNLLTAHDALIRKGQDPMTRMAFFQSELGIGCWDFIRQCRWVNPTALMALNDLRANMAISFQEPVNPPVFQDTGFAGTFSGYTGLGQANFGSIYRNTQQTFNVGNRTSMFG